MNILDNLNNIVSNPNIISYPFKYCLVNQKKQPFNIDDLPCHLNNLKEFVSINDILNMNETKLLKYQGLGISIQASNVTAIDVDHCFNIKWNINSGDNRAKNILDLFRDYYCEFSFSGSGLRIFFLSNPIKDYSDIYYTKNSKNNIEFYPPYNCNKYVTITGRFIYNNPIKNCDLNRLNKFLNIYMRREKIRVKSHLNMEIKDDRSMEELNKKLRRLLIVDPWFQEVWFSRAPGSGHDESEKDYYLISTLYEKITKNKDKLRRLFEESDFFKSKDLKHVYKWEDNNHAYYDYVYNHINNTCF